MPKAESRRIAGGRHLWVVVLALVLVGAIGLQFILKPKIYSSASYAGKLARILPSQVDGWVVADEALGDTEGARKNVEDILNYDDYVYRRYSAAGREFAVYMAHWAAGRMPTRLVTLHVPDRCWVENGWTCLEAKFNISSDLRSLRMPPAQWRIFTPPNQQRPVYVSFWLTRDGVPYNFGDRLNTIPSPLRYVSQIVRESFEQSGEQLFVRITSDRSLTEFAGDAGFEKVMDVVAKALAPTQ